MLFFLAVANDNRFNKALVGQFNQQLGGAAVFACFGFNQSRCHHGKLAQRFVEGVGQVGHVANAHAQAGVQLRVHFAAAAGVDFALGVFKSDR